MFHLSAVPHAATREQARPTCPLLRSLVAGASGKTPAAEVSKEKDPTGNSFLGGTRSTVFLGVLGGATQQAA